MKVKHVFKWKRYESEILPEFFRQLQQPEQPQEIAATTIAIPVQVGPVTGGSGARK